MKSKFFTTVHARDVVISKARLIPSGLLMKLETEESGFLISFLINSSETFLQELLKKSEIMGNHDFELWFFEKATSKAIPKEIPVSKRYDFLKKAYEVEIHECTSPYQKYAEGPPVYHIDVIFNTYNMEVK